MGTQFQRLTASRAWGPESVQADSARILEAPHVVSQAGLQLPRGFRRPPRPREEQHVWPWQPKRDHDRHRPLYPQLSPSGRPLPCCGFGAWNILVPNRNPNPTPTGTLPRNLSLPRSLILHLSGLLAWALTSALEGDHETGVASALATSLDRTLILAKALPSWGPNSNV